MAIRYERDLDGPDDGYPVREQFTVRPNPHAKAKNEEDEMETNATTMSPEEDFFHTICALAPEYDVSTDAARWRHQNHGEPYDRIEWRVCLQWDTGVGSGRSFDTKTFGEADQAQVIARVETFVALRRANAAAALGEVACG